MLPDRVSNPGPLTYEPCALPIALRGPALYVCKKYCLSLEHKFENGCVGSVLEINFFCG